MNPCVGMCVTWTWSPCTVSIIVRMCLPMCVPIGSPCVCPCVCMCVHTGTEHRGPSIDDLSQLPFLNSCMCPYVFVLHAHTGVDHRDPSIDDLSQLPFLNSVIDETMRMYPVAATASVRCVCVRACVRACMCVCF